MEAASGRNSVPSHYLPQGIVECIILVGSQNCSTWAIIWVVAMSRRGFLYVHDAWVASANTFISSADVVVRFGLQRLGFPAWDALCHRLLLQGQRLLIQCKSSLEKKEWIGLYADPGDPFPLRVTQGASNPICSVGHPPVGSPNPSRLQPLHGPSQVPNFFPCPANPLKKSKPSWREHAWSRYSEVLENSKFSFSTARPAISYGT